MIITTHNFDELTEQLINSTDTYLFNLKDLPDAFEYTPTKEDLKKSIRDHDKFSSMFAELDAKRGSCLYWFEVDDNPCCSSLIEKLNIVRPLLRGQGNIRIVPVMNKNSNSNVLYVGIRRKGWTEKWKLSNISGRIIQHLGYYRVGTTQGLQLAHWASDSDLQIKLNVIEFEEYFPNEYLEALEKIMAHRLKPLCGKH